MNLPQRLLAPAPGWIVETDVVVVGSGIAGLTTALRIGGLSLVVSPFAWALGRNALKEIRASQGQQSGESRGQTGMVTGVIGTVLLILALLAVVGLVVVGVSTSTGGSSTSTDSSTF